MIRRPLFLLLSLVVFAALVAGLAYRPATIAGVHAGDLAKSIEDSAGGLSNAVCDQRPDGSWRCEAHRKVGKVSGAVGYRVRVQGHFGCWHGTRVSGVGLRRLSSCITVFDYL